MKLKSLIAGLLIPFMLVSCKDFLEEKPVRSLTVPSTLKDLQAILDRETMKSDSYPDAGDIASDYFVLKDQDWNTLSEEHRDNYLRTGLFPANVLNWSSGYSKVFNANVVLEEIDNISSDGQAESERLRIKGEALFIRGWAFYHLAQIFTLPYNKEKAGSMLGIPLRMTANISAPTVRASLDETYARIIKDLKESAALQPDLPQVRTRSSRASSFAALSRVYLVMGDYQSAGFYADSCLQLYHKLINYNTLDTIKPGQFQALNDEVIFHARFIGSSGAFSNSKAAVDPDLYALYAKGDLRKPIFYKKDAAGVIGFYGDYAGSLSSSTFAGITTSEVLLTKAECEVRLGKVTEGINDLNELLKNRWKAALFQRLTIENQAEALDIVLKERYKELAFRGGIRWPDLRRLSSEAGNAKILSRTVMGKTYMLEPGSRNYVFLIPYETIDLTGIPQN